ncbi:MAG: hypothetical protein FWF07_01305 [Methanomassiliicoccaceae archaeon]|nr:hypothetical protein [Methanomassiliicoccaceae archaeon]
MKDNLIAAQLIDTLYMMIAENVPDDICRTCPVIRAVRDLKDAVNNANYEQTIAELGLMFPRTKCPCDK